MRVSYINDIYPDKGDIMVIDHIEFDTDDIIIDNIYARPLAAVKHFVGDWILQVIDEFYGEPQIDDDEFEYFWECIDSKEDAYLRIELAELEDYTTAYMVVNISEGKLAMMLDVCG